MTEVSGEGVSDDDIAALVRRAVVFEVGDPPRTGQVAFQDADGGSADIRLSIGDAVSVLTLAGHEERHPTAAFWGDAVVMALELVARGRILPGVSPGDFDAWRVGPLEQEDLDRIRALDPSGSASVRAFLDAVADEMPRTPAAVQAAGTSAFAAQLPQSVPELRGWADELAAGLDSGVRISLRVEMPDDDYLGGSFRAVLQLQSLADPAQVIDASELWAGEVNRLGPQARVDALLAVRRAARVWSPLERLLHAAVPDELMLADADVEELLDEAVPRLAAIGVDVHWPKELIRELSARGVIGARESASSDLPSFFGGGTLLDFNWQLALGDELLTEAEMDQLAEARRPVVRLRDRWMLVDRTLARKARDRALKPLTAMDALTAALTGTAEVEGERVEVVSDGWLDIVRKRVAEPDSESASAQPPALAATLRDYQLRGFQWLVRMTSLGLNGCLADDMGLGKTITLIALHLHRQASPETAGPTLVVCPASLLGNWEREIRRFAPGTTVQRFHSTERSLDAIEDGFVLTTYGTMRVDAARLAGVGWRLVVADEAQHVKNPRSGTAKALRMIPADTRIALTGTPVENNLSELWAILDWTTPGLLGSLTEFRERWAEPIEANHDHEAGERLSRLVRPFLLRRKKTDPGIAPELPPKTETDRPVTLTQEQAGLYEAVVRETMAQIAESDGMARRGLIMKLFTSLRQICNHPAHYLKDQQPTAARSGKLELLDELLDTITAEAGAVLVFTQFAVMAKLLERHLAERGIPAQLLHGGTPIPQREAMVERFQNGEVPVFVLSLKAAGTGLNLTRADHVVHYDRWWNPAVEDQATDRAYRIGQTRPVQVHRLIAEGTVEDQLASLLQGKRHLADSVLSSGEAALTELSDAELADLVTLRSRDW
jgi:superfamily II DNA or RNA helicase